MESTQTLKMKVQKKDNFAEDQISWQDKISLTKVEA